MPIYNPLQSRRYNGKGITEQMDGLNDPNQVHKELSNTFTLPKQRCQTENFSLLTPCYLFDALPRDRVKIQSNQYLRAPSFKQPTISELRHSLDFFAVPYESLMPHTWKYFFTNPIKGDDVPEDAKITVPAKSFTPVSGYSVVDFDVTDVLPEVALEVMNLVCMTYGKQGLLNYLGIKFGDEIYKCVDIINDAFYHFFDNALDYVSKPAEAFEGIFVSLSDYIGLMVATESGVNEYSPEDKVFTFADFTNVNQIFDLIRNKGYIYCPTYNFDGDTIDSTRVDYADSNWYSCYTDEFFSGPEVALEDICSLTANNKVCADFNIAPLLAYQQVVNQFYSNETVDSIFSSEIYMDAMDTLMSFANYTYQSGLRPSSLAPEYAEVYPIHDSFSYNDFNVSYDVISNHYISKVFHLGYIEPGLGDGIYKPFGYNLLLWYNLMTFGRNLRYGDFFTSARVRPLAVGDVTISADGGLVQALDVSQNLARQRFLNFVNRCGSRLKSYLACVFNSPTAIQNAEPHFISHQTNTVEFDKVTSTSGGQNDNLGKVIENPTKLTSEYVLDVYISDPCIILGISSYDILGVYKNYSNPLFFKGSRFDMFNPFLQNIGDQPITTELLCNGENQTNTDFSDLHFGYTVRDAEYKTDVGDTAGLFDNPENQYLLQVFYNPRIKSNDVINSDIIRFNDDEIDHFFISLSPEYYKRFHFVISYNFEVTAVRAMQYAPSIL